MENRKLFRVGINLVKFAWAVEIVAILIGFLISIIVSYSVYFQINRIDEKFTFGDYSTILVAGLPFLLVAIVEATKIPVATAMMYAKHTSWRILLFVGVLFLTTITFETMINGFERNFSNLTLSIDERKNDELNIQHNIELLQEQKIRINTIYPNKVESQWKEKVTIANTEYNKKITTQREFTKKQVDSLIDNNKETINTELTSLHERESQIYESWDQERKILGDRLRNLVNQNIEGSTTDKEKLSMELEKLKEEMKIEMNDSTFLTRSAVEKKYRNLIEKKEQRLYKVTDYAVGGSAIAQQTKSEKQLQEHLKVIGKNYQIRIDSIQDRINYLNKALKSNQDTNEFLAQKYHTELKTFTKSAIENRDVSLKRASTNRVNGMKSYLNIQLKVKDIDKKIFQLKEEQRQIYHGINKLVNQNQVYRVATYISNENNAIDVPRETVGLVALIWFASLAFICSIAGVFLAIAGIYIQKIYHPSYKETNDTNN